MTHILFSLPSIVLPSLAVDPVFSSSISDPTLVVASPPSVVFSDSFTRANNTNIATGSSISWIERNLVGTAETGLEILNNQLTCNANLYISAIAGDVGSTDHYSECVVSGVVGTSVIYGPMVRANANATEGYVALVLSDRVRLYKIGGGTTTVLNDTTPIVADSMIGTNTIRLQISGTTLKIFINGVEKLTHTDVSTPYTTGQYVGIMGNGPGGAVDDFVADVL